MYKSRHITLKGKITLIRSLIIPIILYTASVIPITEDFINDLEKDFYAFLWPSGKHHVKKDTLIQSIEDGGLQMPDIKAIIMSNKLTWINRLLKSSGNLISIAQTVCGIENLKDFIDKKAPISYTAHMPEFYKQLFGYWDELHGSNPQGINDVYNESLWLNKFLLIEDKPYFSREWSAHGIDRIYDIVNDNGRLMSITEIQEKYVFQVKVMQYNSIISSIPRTWRNKLKYGDQKSTITKFNDIGVYINNKRKDVLKLKCRDYYWHIVGKRYVIPTCIEKWEELYSEYIFEWNDIFLCPFISARETALQSFQYKIIHRFIPCKAALFRWRKADHELCDSCMVKDDIEHFFVKCNLLKPFWNKFFEWWHTTYDIVINLCDLDIIFGIANPERDDMIYNLNFCLLFAKYYIYKCKINDKIISFSIFVKELKNRIEYEQYILTQDNKSEMFMLKWLPLSQSLSGC